MPLVRDDLKDALVSLFLAPPVDFEGCAESWANALASYSETMSPLLVASPEPARIVLKASLLSAFSNPANSADVTSTAMETAWRTFAIALGASIAPPFTSTPVNVPPGLVGFRLLFLIDPFPETHDAAADAVAGAIHSWMLTGTATNTTTGATIPWF